MMYMYFKIVDIYQPLSLEIAKIDAQQGKPVFCNIKQNYKLDPSSKFPLYSLLSFSKYQLCHACTFQSLICTKIIF